MKDNIQFWNMIASHENQELSILTGRPVQLSESLAALMRSYARCMFVGKTSVNSQS